MDSADKTKITVKATVNAPLPQVWHIWNAPEHIVNWAAASADWHTTRSENDLRQGGNFFFRMEAKDGSFGFDFQGVYDTVITHQQIAYTLADGRKVKIVFSDEGDYTQITESFEAEAINPIEMQRGGWQAILDNFKKYTRRPGLAKAPNRTGDAL